MSVAIGIWSQVLQPGKAVEVIPPADVKITNIALGADLADPSGRTSVKLVYKPVTSEDDSDDEAAASEEPSETILCSLTPGKIEQVAIGLILQEETAFVFETVGKNTVYLTGNYMYQPTNEPFGSDVDSEEDEFDLRDVSSDVEVPADELDSDASRFEEVEEVEELPKAKRPREEDMDVDEQKALKSEKAPKKKQKADSGKAVATGTEVTSPEKSKKEKKEKKEGGKETSTPAPTPKKREVAGVQILDAKEGDGPSAKKGDTIRMRYIGKLENGTIFDSNTKGKPFTFKLGSGEVIKGWDVGLAGMKVGGERKLTIPANMAYGKKGTGGIPANSTLIFECKLLEIKK